MKKMSKRAKWITGSIIAVLAIVLIFVGIYTYRVYHSLDNLNKKPEDSIFTNNSKEEVAPKWTGTERVNILLMGGDSRGMQKNEVPRSDSLIVASVDPVTKKGTLFSILRDTYVDIPGHGKERINAALAYGGPNLAMKSVSDLLGIPIQYYVYVDFKGFIALIDAIDGIDFYVEKDMKYSSKADKHEYDIDLKKGMQHLDGKSALQYVRFRHDAMSDFTRTERQREFLKAVASKMQTTWSIMKLPDILEKVNPFIETNLNIDDMWKLAALGYDSQIGSSEQIPPMKLISEDNAGGAAVIGIKNEQALKDFVQETFTKDTAPPATPTDGTGTGTGSGTGTDQTKTDSNSSSQSNSTSTTSK
jgi:LCP family protein required for cell wall assembly